MKSKEKIIKSLKSCLNDNCHNCGYFDIDNDSDCDGLLKDVLALIEQLEENNAENAWELVRQIFKRDARDLDEIFGCSPGSVINNLDYYEAKEKFNKWNEQRALPAGTEVEDKEAGVKMIIFNVDGIYVRGINCDTKEPMCLYKEDVVKTGKYIDLTELFKQIEA